ncbi:glycine/D-amino acid oxidase-like deaminating enzyme [Paracidovorax anthurii]|uniref:Glycine/D-amino acid oxidase-like deaminating enzyme n=2 Tax=Paracidovorax anthurii TaxID=78229 RepID=A0A328YTV8_9BURK|nr:FAD-binding oxidoreductase [Paracidovorax anthurii]RAR77431.1 glycine/D-amino acid oxidase-like deaminating enzyme [Paracidovorax anthurii]
MSAQRVPGPPAGAMPNGWSAILPPRTPAPMLRGDHRADWLVLGAGVAGLAAARRIAELRPASRVVLLDAGTVGDNASGRNSGFAIDLPHSVGTSQEELRQAARYQRILGAGMDALQALVARHAIDCQWRRAGKFHCAAGDAAGRVLARQREELERIGAPCEWLDAPALARRLGSAAFQAGLYTPGTVLLNPAALCRGLADALPPQVALFENTRVLSVSLGEARVVAHTPQGRVEAPQLFVAANGFARQLGLLARETFPLATFASLSDPLTPDQRARLGAPEGWGATPVNAITGATLRYTDDHRLLVRQGIAYAPGMQAPAGACERARRAHRAVFDARFPALAGLPLPHFWQGAIAMTRNGAPRWGGFAPRVHGVVGCNGAGLVKHTALAMLAVDQALGQDQPLIADALALGRPAPLPPEPFMGWGARAYLARERWAGRAEA